ncbi:MAG TPA: DNA repair protein [Xanthobacteraceae bacterium]|nr:DNA repair protein [Xanthobacteraceae bacterium]
MSSHTIAYTDSSDPLSAPSRCGVLTALRHAIRGIEGRHVEADQAASLMSLGLAAIDETLGGGLPRAALHEIAAESETATAPACAFTLTLAKRGARDRAVLWIAEDMALMESGAPYGPGLDEIGLAPEQMVTVAAARARDVLWAMEEALRCRAVGAVIGEIRKENAIDAVASRRLSLAASQQDTLALLLRVKPDTRPVAAATRWIVGALSAAPVPHGIGPPALAVRLVRNRSGRLGSWVLEWNRAEQCFHLASAHPQPMAGTAVDGSRDAAVA